MEFKVIDASALLHSDFSCSNQRYLVPNSVMLEILDEKTRILAEQALKSGRLKILDPGEDSIKKVVSKASKTGDDSSLSKADVDLIALALEKKTVLLSDDYAIQNTARQLGLKVEFTAQEGIKKTVKWVKLCEGCGRKYEASTAGVCGVCGSRLRKHSSG
ncbi:MAG: hypothetical protein FJY77_03275 [Candidatus Altiarchaeales archaeon]|nr:hypothetical protein [Candidatus Altiarchaeales archaeon]